MTDKSKFEWQEIRIENSDDGQFEHNPVCQGWVSQLASFVMNKLGTSSPCIKVRPYSSGNTTLLAVDVYGSQSDMECVNITILLSDHTCLSIPADKQFDIELPGIIDAFGLVELLIFFRQNNKNLRKSYKSHEFICKIKPCEISRSINEIYSHKL